MKNLKVIALSLLSVFVLGGVAFAVNQPNDPGIKKHLTGTDQATPSKVYKMVRLSNSGLDSASRVSGDAVVYDTNSDDGVTVRTTTTSADGSFAGILVTALQSSDAVTGTSAADDIGRRNWGFIQVHGPCVATVGAGGTNNHSVGDFFITSTDAGAITTIQNRAGAGALVIVREGGLREVASKGGFFFDAAVAADTQAEVMVEKE